MSRSVSISRRRALTLLASVFGMAGSSAILADEKPSDRGIGGTGISADPMAPEVRSVGFVGTIQRFGSIYVNGVRITYPKDMPIRVDGRETSAANLKIGQVVRVVTREDNSRFSARRIDIVSEVIGPIDAVSSDGMSVLGQTVVVDKAKRPRWWRSGARVAISGIRRTDGVIVASLVERAGSRPDQIAGVAEMQGWNLRIGGLQLLGIHENFGGRRIVVQGRPSPRGLIVSHARVDLPFQGTDVDRVSYETYVAQDGLNVRTGSGVEFRDLSLDRPLGDGRNFRVVLDIGIDRAGGMHLDGMSLEASRSGPMSGSGAPFFDGSQPVNPGFPGKAPFGNGFSGAAPGAAGPSGASFSGGMPGNGYSDASSFGGGGGNPGMNRYDSGGPSFGGGPSGPFGGNRP